MKTKRILSTLLLGSLFSISPLFAMEEVAPQERHSICIDLGCWVPNSPESKKEIQNSLAKEFNMSPEQVEITNIVDCSSPRGRRSKAIGTYSKRTREDAS